MISQRKLEIVEVEIEPDKHDADLGVEDRGIAAGDGLVVFGPDVAAVGRVCGADEGDVLGAEFLLDAGFADDEDLALVGWEVEDARDVDRRAVGGGEDFFLFRALASVWLVHAAWAAALRYRRGGDS